MATEILDGGASALADGGGIVARGVRRSFGAVEALRGVDLDVPAGEVTALVGPNGAGKTTLLLVLATLLVPDGGTVRVAGHDPLTEPEAVRARLGWSPDVFGIYDSLTAREYLEFVGAAYRLPAAQARARAGELLAVARLETQADQPVSTLSRGQKQRLGLVRALVHRPSVLVLDEPASGLDPRSRLELRDLLRGLAREGCAVLVSSHVLSDLEELADRAVFVDHGQTVGAHRLDALPAVAVGSRPWRLRSLDPAALLTALDGHGYTRGEPGPHGIDVLLAGDTAAAALVAGLVRDGVPLVSCASAGGSLEAAYLDLVEQQQ